MMGIAYKCIKDTMVQTSYWSSVYFNLATNKIYMLMKPDHLRVSLTI